MKISEILRKAANEHLHDLPEIRFFGGVWMYSCCAVAESENGHDEDDSVDLESSQAVAFLREFEGSTGIRAFSDEIDPQGARFLWLHFAALVAEDEGL